MNIYKWTTAVTAQNDRFSRPTVRLIILYRALHNSGLKDAKDLVEDLYPKEGNYAQTYVEFLVDDTALGRLAFATQNRSYYEHIRIERLSANLSGFNVIGADTNA
jgi:hypothetical protein